MKQTHMNPGRRRTPETVRQMIITIATILLDLCAYLQLEAHAQLLA
jgi:hypothetical protein